MTAAAHIDMDLRLLFPGLAPTVPEIDVVDIAAHSSEVVPGGLFLACSGRTGHGLRFLGEALERGARAVAWETAGVARAPTFPDGVCGLAVPGLDHQLGDIANRFFNSPSSCLAVTGITGTNGKTTVAWLLTQALERLGRCAAYMGTLGYGLGTAVRASDLTTPDCVTVHRRLRELADAGASDVAAEVSSHALDQGRIDGIALRIAAFTNLSRDHLDYHADMASYGASKARLFLDAAPSVAVINIGDEFGRSLARQLPPAMRQVTVSAVRDRAASSAMLQARRLSSDAQGARVALSVGERSVQFATTLAGGFNVENLAVTAGILLAEGFDLEQLAAALGACTAPPGRMQPVVAGRGPRVVVDFAHTPDALCRALAALRPPAPARLWCVFGCGGERDAGKREAMGKVARTLADRIVVTDDNPRHEDPDAIVAAVLRGTGRGSAVEIIRDRAAAIRHAIRLADAADVVLIAGKGHETVQIVGDELRPFSDQAVARAALDELS